MQIEYKLGQQSVLESLYMETIFNPKNCLITTPKFAYFEYYSPQKFFSMQTSFCNQTVSQTHQQTTTYPPPDLIRQSCVLKHYNRPSNEFLGSYQACFKDRPS